MNDIKCEDCFFNLNGYCYHPSLCKELDANFSMLQKINFDYCDSAYFYRDETNLRTDPSYAEVECYCYKHRFFIPKIEITRKMKSDLLDIESHKIQSRLIEIDNELKILR